MTLDIIPEATFRTNGRPRRITGGKLTGQKPALKMKEVWSIRARLELKKRVRDLALFNLAIDSKLRGCEDVAPGGGVRARAIIIQQKTKRPVQFEITEHTRTAVSHADPSARPTRNRPSFPEPACDLAPTLNQAVCAHRPGMGQLHRAQRRHIRHAFAAAHQGCPHLSQDGQSPRGPAAAGAQQAREYGPLPRRGGGRRPGDLRAGRPLENGRRCCSRGFNLGADQVRTSAENNLGATF